MAPRLAALIFVAGIATLFRLDSVRESRTSKALWIAIVWLLIAGSRSVSAWLAAASGNSGSVNDVNSDPNFYLEGNPTDRFVLIALLVVGVIVLLSRQRKVGKLLAANVPILLFFAYCAISCSWSDYPDVAFKRWIKFLGDFVMVLVVLTELDPLTAVKEVLAYAGFVLVPVSVLLIKYYPDLGRGYHPWDWTPYYTGVTTNKNELGYVCLVFGLASIWRILSVVSGERTTGKTGVLVAHGTILAMVFWLFAMAGSMTSLSCFLMGTVIVMTANMRIVTRRPWAVHLIVGTMLAASVSTLFLDVGSGVLETMGRNPTLTGRTEIWRLVLKMTGNPILGTGFESFWLGKRLEKMWSVYWWHPNQSHNGYIEIFVNLGWLGVLLLSVLILTNYQNVVKAFRSKSEAGKPRLAFFVVAVAYNFTESAFKAMHPVWIVFLLMTISVPGGWVLVGAKKKAPVRSEEVSCQEQA